MTEETNLDMGLEDGSDLFTDEQTSEQEVDAPEVQQEEEHEDEPQEDVNEKPEDTSGEDKPTLRIKYNGEEKDITMDEAVILAQKGMNYDHALDSMRRQHEEETGIIEYFAKQNNMTKEQYLNFLKQQQTVSVQQRHAAELKNQHPEWPRDVIEQMSKMMAENEKRDFERREADRKEEERQRQMQPWRDFSAKYPQYKDVKEIPKEVMDMVGQGISPMQAMQAYEMREKDKRIHELEQKLEIEKNNKKNKEKAVGSVASTGAGDTIDPFLDGLLR